jgi:hypothetical protein
MHDEIQSREPEQLSEKREWLRRRNAEVRHYFRDADVCVVGNGVGQPGVDPPFRDRLEGKKSRL